MKLWKKLAGAVTHPLKLIDDEIKERLSETAIVTTNAVLEHVGTVLPEIGDLLAGEEITIEVMVKLRIKQKGEI